MIRINLLPHREAKRKQNKNAFYRLLILAASFAGIVALSVAVFIETRISEQNLRNAFIQAENRKLDKQIEEIASLKQDIEALKARQQAVEDLQSDRNQPVYLLDELVKQVPEGIFLRGFKQEGQKVSLSGVAQSNERVSQLLHNFTSGSPWLERPDLIEIKASNIGQGKDVKRVFDFTMNVAIKRPRNKEKAASEAKANTVSSTPDSSAIVVPVAPKPGKVDAVKPVMPLVVTATAVTNGKAATAKVTDAGVSGAPVANTPKKP